ncbi:MAG TPA: OmpA family protein [Thermoanaerobaculia bacterium]|nr:OmpA family protein [Thermoanaerobaculia bacterium]
MRNRKLGSSFNSLAGVLALAAVIAVIASLGACATAQPPAAIADARTVLEAARADRAEELATRPFDEAARHLNVAESTWRQNRDGEGAAHWARRAEAAARRAQYEALARAAEEEIRLQTERRNRAELAVRDAEIARLQAQGRNEAEQRAAEAEREARRAERRAEEERAARERATEEARREAEARAEAEAQAREERLRREEELERRETQAEQERLAAEARLEEERRRLDEQRRAEEARTAEIERLRQEQEQTREELRTTLSRLAEVRQEARGLVVTLPGSIYFAVNKSVVQPSMRSRLTEIAGALAGADDSTILIEGHTDSDGSNEYNLELSRLRAEAVRSVLVAGGVPAGSIETQGYGETRPVAPNTSASGKAQNRRVEIIIQGGAASPGR